MSLPRPLPHPLPFPISLTQRELGFPTQKNKNTSYYSSFREKHLETLKTLKTGRFLSVNVNGDINASYDPVPIYSLEKVSDKLIASDERGNVHVIPKWFQNPLHPLSQRKYNMSSTNISEKSAVYTLKCVDNGKLLAGTGCGSLFVLDLGTLSVIRVLQSHEKSVKRVDTVNGDIIATCSRDNSIRIHDLRMNSVNAVNVINEAHTMSPPNQNSGVRTRRRRKDKVDYKSSPASSVTDLAFIDEHNLVSCGAADGIIKQWDLRVTYKLMQKFHPVTVLEFPGKSHNQGYGCLKVFGSKLYASTVQNEIFQFDLNQMKYEVSYMSPSKLSYYTKLDVNTEGSYLATGSDTQDVHIFKTSGLNKLRGVCGREEPYQPIHTLTHCEGGEEDGPVCCAVFSPTDDLEVTTGDDMSMVRKWVPSIYFEDFSTSMKEAERLASALPEMKTEFKYLYRKDSEKARLAFPPSPINSNDFTRSLKLDSFPNHVVDGTSLPHVVPRIYIKARNRRPTTNANNWLKSPDTTANSNNLNGRKAEEVTPKRKTPAARKRRKFSNDTLSPKIFEFFKTSSPLSGLPSSINEH